ncbi:MAG: translation initiation factor IF-2 [Gemmatimonadetes bacterium]|nr:translation initiation factor IF-2 [Gemmatimonadota bacterium]
MLVAEFAKDLKVSAENLVSLLRAMGVSIHDGDAPVSEADIARVLARVERERRSGKMNTSEALQAAIGETNAPSKRRRRRKAEDVAPEDEPSPAVPDDQASPSEPDPPVGLPSAEASEPPKLRKTTKPKPAGRKAVAPDEGASEAAPGGSIPSAEAPASELSEAASGEEGDPEAKPKRRLKMPEFGPPVVAAPPPPPPPEPAQARKLRLNPSEFFPTPARPTPAASAGPGGQVRIQADGFTADGRKKLAKKKGKKRQRVDQDAVQDNVTRVMAELKGGGKKKRKKGAAGPTREELEAQEEEQRQLVAEEAKTVRVNEFLTVAELSELIQVPSTELVGAAFKNLGLPITINQRLAFDQLELLLEHFNFKAVREEDYARDAEVEEDEEEEDLTKLVPRPPVVTVMGHVDHGKTLLLDSIRKTNVVAGESGGITQHIGAYHVELDGGRAISFLDTPGHAAFTAMRARGAEVTDIVVLVVAADDSVMPQTIEAISHAKNAGVPIVVAVNKSDLPAANPRRVKQELLQHGVAVEEFGGDVLVAEVSAKTGKGIDDLLEKILLQADVLELKANPESDAKAAVIEARLDVGKGPVVTVLVLSGTLRVGDAFVCGKFEGRVRALLDERGRPLTEVTPGLPVQLVGSGGVPQAGDSLQVMDADRAGEIAQARQRLERDKQLRIRAKGVRLGDLAHHMRAGKEVPLLVLVKADVDGSVQALSDSLEQLSTPEVRVQIVHRGVGAVNESDVLLAETAGAIIVGFRVRPDMNARLLAEHDGIEIHLYEVIYEAVDDITKAMEGMLSPESREKILGSAEVRETFKISKVGTIAGCYVAEGVIDRKGKVRLIRDGSVVYTGEISSLKRFKDDAREVRDGYECGIAIANFNDVKVGDLIECYVVEEIARTLAGSSSGRG